MRIDVAQSAGFTLPFSIGVYDFGNSSPVVQIDFTDIPNGEGYHWYKIPATKMPSNGYAFASNALTGQLIPPPMEIFGKMYEVWFSAKHVGEQFHKGQGKPEYIYIDRVAFVEP